MNYNRSDEYLVSIVQELCKSPSETEWVEFKHNNDNPKQIGEYISALSNSAALMGKVNAYMIWGVDDKTHELIGTDFKLEAQRIRPYDKSASKKQMKYLPWWA